MEAPSGLEPLNRGFADLSLSHLGTAPSLDSWGIIVFYAIHSRKRIEEKYAG